MRCGQFEERLHDLLDRRFEPRKDRELARHARRCPACRETLAACTRMLDGLDLMEVPVPDDDFSVRVLSRTPLSLPRRAIRPRATRRRFGASVAAIATALAVSILAFVAWRTSRIASPLAPPSLIAALPDTSGVPAEPARGSDLSFPHGQDRSALLALAPQQPWSLWLRWQETWSSADWSPVDGLANGLNPITVPLSVAVEEIRRTIPLSLVEPPPAPPADSARHERQQDELPVA